ncbi:MAG: GNAT family N-acetyltransferase [Candidatus Velthaea sp.]
MQRRPYENVFLQWVLEGGHGPGAPDAIMLYRNRTGAVTGAIYFGTQLVLAASDEGAVDAFAVEARRHPGLRSFVGTTPCVEQLWERVRTWHPAPVISRAHQPLYALQPAALVRDSAAGVRPATLDEAELVAEHSAQMMLGELGYDPRVNRSGFTAAVRRAIAQGSWWVWLVEGELRFQCNVGARTRATAQIQGVWTPPEARGRGYATAALGAIARELLETNATLSLHVNDFNRTAIALYERLGFVRVGELSTLLF